MLISACRPWLGAGDVIQLQVIHRRRQKACKVWAKTSFAKRKGLLPLPKRKPDSIAEQQKLSYNPQPVVLPARPSTQEAAVLTVRRQASQLTIVSKQAVPFNLALHLLVEQPSLSDWRPEILAQRLAELSSALDLTCSEVVDAVICNPTILTAVPYRLQRELDVLAAHLDVTRTQILPAVLRQPSLLHASPAAVSQWCEQLAEALHWDVKKMTALVIRAPDLLEVHPTMLPSRISNLANMLDISNEDVHGLTQRCPELLLPSASDAAHNFQRLVDLLGVEGQQVAVMCRKAPMIVTVPADHIQRTLRNLHQLANFGSLEQTMAAVFNHPDVLLYPVEVLQERLHCLRLIFECDRWTACGLARTDLRYLSQDTGVVEARVIDLQHHLHLTAKAAVAVGQLPSVMFDMPLGSVYDVLRGLTSVVPEGNHDVVCAMLEACPRLLAADPQLLMHNMSILKTRLSESDAFLVDLLGTCPPALLDAEYVCSVLDTALDTPQSPHVLDTSQPPQPSLSAAPKGRPQHAIDDVRHVLHALNQLSGADIGSDRLRKALSSARALTDALCIEAINSLDLLMAMPDLVQPGVCEAVDQNCKLLAMVVAGHDAWIEELKSGSVLWLAEVVRSPRHRLHRLVYLGNLNASKLISIQKVFALSDRSFQRSFPGYATSAAAKSDGVRSESPVMELDQSCV